MSNSANTCKHCAEDIPALFGSTQFCCVGCEGAYNLLKGMGLTTYYNRKEVDGTARPLIPEAALDIDFSPFTETDESSSVSTIHLIVDGIHCAACVWLIETLLLKMEGVTYARLNMTTRRLTLSWNSAEITLDALLTQVHKVGYRLMPYNPETLKSTEAEEEKKLLLYMAVSGFAAANVMLLSVAVWHGGGMGDATKSFMDWLSAVIALPVAVYAGQPFFKSALLAVKAKGVNMDVPISLAIITACSLSVYDTIYATGYTYYDSAITLVFFLLIGRFLDKRARNKANTSAENLMYLKVSSASIIMSSGSVKTVPASTLVVGDTILVAKGEIIPTDAKITMGETTVDTSSMTGESIPENLNVGDNIIGGTLNLGSAIHAQVTAKQKDSALTEITRITENALCAKQGKQQLADKAAKLYAPVVHILSGATFVGWLTMGNDIHASITAAIAVLIVTCPCALALAIPTVQVTAHGTLMKRGIILKNPAALERMLNVKTILFDKTGTLTSNKITLEKGADSAHLKTAVQLAMNSKHPLSVALVNAWKQTGTDLSPTPRTTEVEGQGLTSGTLKLGRGAFCGLPEADDRETIHLMNGDKHLETFTFNTQLRADAAETISALNANHIQSFIVSGDQRKITNAIGCKIGVNENNCHAELSPTDKHKMAVKKVSEATTIMVGDGINDAPALAAADVSFSFAGGTDIARTCADVILSGWRLMDIPFTLAIANKANRIIKQNLGLSLAYNAIAVPLAMAGIITPLLAAVLMSSSSILVMLNALRLKKV
jgi:Cu2+-exporting ATPase